MAPKVEKFEIELIRGEGLRALRDGQPVIFGDDVTGVFEQLCLFFELDPRQLLDMAQWFVQKKQAPTSSGESASDS